VIRLRPIATSVSKQFLLITRCSVQLHVKCTVTLSLQCYNDNEATKYTQK
jgi:hypothetical protein